MDVGESRPKITICSLCLDGLKDDCRCFFPMFTQDDLSDSLIGNIDFPNGECEVE